MTEAPAVAAAHDRARPPMRSASPARADEFAAVFQDNFRRLSGYCYALLRDEQLAHDIAQESFTRLFARWRRVHDPKAFVFITATNLIRDEWRRRTRHASIMERVHPLLLDSAEQPDHALHDIVRRLPSRLRNVVVLHLVVDLPVAEVARHLGIPEGTVKRRLHEARALLRLDWLEAE